MCQAEKQDVGRLLANQREGGCTVRDFAHDAEIWLCLQKATEAVAKDGVLARNDQPDELCLLRHD